MRSCWLQEFSSGVADRLRHINRALLLQRSQLPPLHPVSEAKRRLGTPDASTVGFAPMVIVHVRRLMFRNWMSLLSLATVALSEDIVTWSRVSKNVLNQLTFPDNPKLRLSKLTDISPGIDAQNLGYDWPS